MSVQTTCPYCGVGCGIRASIVCGTVQPVTGDDQHPANRGRLCVKGSSVHETLGLKGRLLQPRVDGETVSWEQAIDSVAERLTQVRQQYGSDAIAFYLSGQLLTEDYYVANKLAKGFLGTPHVDTNSRLCMSSAVAAHKRAFGADVVPACYEDLEQADLLVIVGANPAWNHPILHQRIQKAARAGRRVVVIDPRATATCDLADLHLALKPGSDAVLFNGLLVWLADRGALAHSYLKRHVNGVEAALDAARASAPDLSSVARQCDLEEADVADFYRWFSDTPRTVTLFSQGINQSSSGTDKGNAIINAHLATGRVGLPGASPFSITGQPNAMGGREVGGLANQLAAHLDYETPGARQLVSTFWNAPALPERSGLKAVDLFDAVADGRIKAIWIMATNPVVSLPDAERVRAALAACPTVIVSDCMRETDTLALATIALPASGWSEKDGTVTNSERCISRQRALLPPAGEARADWRILTEVAHRLGYTEAFPYASAHDIFREHARLTGMARSLDQDYGRLDLSGLQDLDRTTYDALAPVQWPVNERHPRGAARLFGDGRFCTKDGRARMVPIKPRPPQQLPELHALTLNTGRLRDQWHSMTRTGRAARLLQHRAEPFIEIHPNDAERLWLKEGDLAQVQGYDGRFVGRVRVTSTQRPGDIFLPIHWTAQFSSAGRIGSLLAPVTDPLSGQPEFKQGQVYVRRLDCRWQARLLYRHDGTPPADATYWARVPHEHCEAWYLAGDRILDWPEAARHWLGGQPTLALSDPASSRYRAARLDQLGRLQALLLIELHNDFPGLDWLDSLFGQPSLSAQERQALLAGYAADVPEIGNIVCTCRQVGQRQIERVIANGGVSLDALKETLGCGATCGSCVPELKSLLADTPSPRAAPINGP